MSNRPDDNNNEQEPVQDYLDLLLTSATENPETSVDNDLQQPITPAAFIPPPNNVTPFTGLSRGSASSSVHTLRTKPKTATKRRLNDDANNRPHARPSQPLSLKTPLPLVKPELIPELVINTAVEIEQLAEQSPPVTEWVNGRPAWAQERFECLLFGVGGLTLAVPLVELGTIYPVTDEITPLFGQIDWLLGLLPVKEGSLRIIDTPKVVMPERYRESMKDDFQYVISINAMDWGLAVDMVSNTIMLKPENVCWRSKRSKRPWLAGTVMEHRCTLVDVSQLAAMLAAEDAKNNSKH